MVGVAIFGLGIYVHNCAPERSLGWPLVVLFAAWIGELAGERILDPALSGSVGPPRWSPSPTPSPRARAPGARDVPARVLAAGPGRDRADRLGLGILVGTMVEYRAGRALGARSFTWGNPTCTHRLSANTNPGQNDKGAPGLHLRRRAGILSSRRRCRREPASRRARAAAVELQRDGATPGETGDVRRPEVERLDQRRKAAGVVGQGEVRGHVRRATRARLVPRDDGELVRQAASCGRHMRESTAAPCTSTSGGPSPARS